MNSYTPEQAKRWTRLMAEAEGWKNLEVIERNIRDADNFPVTVTELRGDFGGAKWIAHRASYSTNLNALARVARKICEEEKGKDLLEEAFFDYWLLKGGNLYKMEAGWIACLSPEELFPIYGKVLEELNERNPNG